MSEHTPGPWGVTGRLDEHITAGDGFEVARVKWRDHTSNEAGDEHDANARLIAAAPALYAACDAAYRVIDALHREQHGLVWAWLRDALAKARGASA